MSEALSTISETQARDCASHRLIENAYAVEDDDGFKLVLIVNGVDCYLAPRRRMDQARKFKRFCILTSKFRSLVPYLNESIMYIYRNPFTKK